MQKQGNIDIFLYLTGILFDNLFVLCSLIRNFATKLFLL